MKSTIDAYLGRHLARWVATVQRKPHKVLAAIAVLTLCFALLAGLKLGINSNNLDLISPKLPSRIEHARFSALFPNIENALLVVVDGESAEKTRQAANRLTEHLNQLPEYIENAYSSNGGDFFEKHGLLYLDLDELQSLSEDLNKVRPFVIPLERDPNLVTLTNLVIKNMRATRFSFDYEEQWAPLIDQMNVATLAALGESTKSAAAQTWQTSSLTKTLANHTSNRQVIIAHPVLEFGNILAANRSIKAVRTLASDLEIDASNGFSVRITGNPALNLEEMIGIAWDIGVAGIFCFVLVIIVLIFALRSFPLVVATIATLLIGLVWTAGFAALAVGHLNIVSLSVAILFIGLGVDFAIHLGMRYADSLRSGVAEREAMQLAVNEVGSSLLICTVSTAIAFLVFVPTPYLGVAELGLIAGAGMVIIMFLTVSLFPALLITYLRFDAKQHIKSKLRFEARLGELVQQHSAPVLCIAFIALVFGLFVAPKAYFDPNVIEMRDPSTESVQTFNELLDESGLASPWFLNAIAADLTTAKTIAKQAAQLATVEQAITVADLVPKQQIEKLAILNNTSISFVPLDSIENAIPATIEDKMAALLRLQNFIAHDIKKSDTEVFADKERQLINRLAEVQKLALDKQQGNIEVQRVLDKLQGNLIGDLSSKLSDLRVQLSTKGFDLAALPEELHNRMVANDGQARIQFFPKENLRNEDNLRAFVAEVRTIAPHVSGIAVNIIAFEEATKASFKQALGSALFLITLLLIYLWRNLGDVLLVLAPLFLSLILAIACMALLDLPFNFVNVIVIPLMFGIGVDSGIHLVHRSHSGHLHNYNLLNTTTARAVFYSALTTLISFGSLSLSAHKGMSSLGTLLAIGMVLTVACNLIVLPALLERMRPKGDIKTGNNI
jgi:hopanoid biosynthesis associated RND transporter like protein HpnN